MFQTKFDKEKKQWNGSRLEIIQNPKTSLGSEILKVLEVNGPKLAEVIFNNLPLFLYFKLIHFHNDSVDLCANR